MRFTGLIPAARARSSLVWKPSSIRTPDDWPGSGVSARVALLIPGIHSIKFEVGSVGFYEEGGDHDVLPFKMNPIVNRPIPGPGLLSSIECQRMSPKLRSSAPSFRR